MLGRELPTRVALTPISWLIFNRNSGSLQNGIAAPPHRNIHIIGKDRADFFDGSAYMEVIPVIIIYIQKSVRQNTVGELAGIGATLAENIIHRIKVGRF